MKFDDLFELNGAIFKAKIALTIEETNYQKGDIITKTKLQEFDLMDNPKGHSYILTRLNNGLLLEGHSKDRH